MPRACPIGDFSGNDVSPTATFIPATPPLPTPITPGQTNNLSCPNTTENFHVVSGAGQSTTTTITVSGPPGPQGLQGDCGLGFDWKGNWLTGTQYVSQTNMCNASTVHVNGNAYVCILDHVSNTTADKPESGTSWETKWDLLVNQIVSNSIGGDVVWKGNWISTFQYEPNNLVTHKGASYICVTSHFSTLNTEPDPQDNYQGQGTNWHLVSAGLEDPETLLDTFDNFFDWVTDIDNWGFGDWLQAISGVALGAGIIWAGANIISALTSDGTDNGTGNSADQRFASYNGTLGYVGAYTAPLLPDLIADLCDIAGISYDVSELPSEEVNSSLGQITTVSNIIDQLALLYQFDRVESGNIIRFIPKDKPASKVISINDVGYSTDSGEAPFSFKRFQGIDLPRAVKLTYLSEQNNYNTFTQETRFQNFTDGQDVNLQVSMSVPDNKAKEITEIILKNAHLEQMSYGFTASYDQIELEPGDVITTPEGNMRITKIVEEDEGLINFLCTDASNNDLAYTVANTPVQTPNTQTNIEQVIGFSDAFFLDLPALEISDDIPRLFAAVHGYGQTGWPGAAIYKSTNNGSSYELITSTEKESVFGIVNLITPSITKWQVFDDNTTISVVLKTGTLESLSDIDLFNGANRAMIGSEMIQFGNATLTAPNTYTLSHLLRGRQGTDWAITEHVADEPFIFLNASLVELPFELDDRAKPVLYKVVTLGSSLDVTTSTQITPYGINMVPWTQMNPKLVQQTNNNWEITWTERNKWAGDGLDDYHEVNKDNDWAGWTVVILDTNNIDEKRIKHVQKPSYTYTVADQIADWGVIKPCITVKVFGMSKNVGGGYSDIYTCS